MVKLQERNVKGKTSFFFITVPKQFVRLVGWQRGQELVVVPVGERKLEIREMPKQNNSD